MRSELITGFKSLFTTGQSANNPKAEPIPISSDKEGDIVNLLAVFKSLLNTVQFSNFMETTAKRTPIPSDEESDVFSHLCGKLNFDHKKLSQSQKRFLLLELCPNSSRFRYVFLAIPIIVDIPECEENTITLRPNVNLSIEINPAYLLGEHNENETRPEIVLGQQESFDKALVKSKPPRSDKLEEWLHYALELLEETSGYTLHQLAPVFSQKLKQTLNLRFSICALEEENKYLWLNRLYNAALEDGLACWEKTALYRTLQGFGNQLDTQNLNNKTILRVLNNSENYMLGHMDTQEHDELGDLRDRELFSLDNTQRHVLISTSLMRNKEEQGRLLAVNGPPGSGKTAMLKAVIADEWVRAALLNKECPIIVAVGATNISVMNVIDAFPKVAHNTKTDGMWLYRRWIPNCTSYGSYFPSKEAGKNLSNKQKEEIMIGKIADSNEPCIFSWEDDSAALTELRGLDNLVNNYKINADRYFESIDVKTSQSLQKIIITLTQLLNNTLRMMQDAKRKLRHHATLKKYDALNAFIRENQHPQIKPIIDNMIALVQGNGRDIIEEVCRERIRDEGISSDNNYRQLYEETLDLLIERYLDIEYRSKLFHLAARYWEGQYLLESSQELLFSRTGDNVIKGLRRMCMITPCLVSTFHSIPKLLQIRAYSDGDKIEQFCYGAIDCLITDETGQADIRLGLPVMGLAKKVIAVGDVNQLEPVISDLTPAQEYNTFLRHGIDRETFSFLFTRRYTPCSGSLLHLIRSVSCISYQGPGLMLRGHYRCQQKIIQYCNEMLYDNKLFYIPILKKQDGFLPPMSWVASSSPSQGKGSRSNESEAQLIAGYLVEKWSQIKKHYQDKDQKAKKEIKDYRIADIVAIITPFKAQPARIKHSLQKATEDDSTSEITIEDINNMTVGTIHSLQGAEKDIVIFSGVQVAADGGTPFFASQQYLLNVGISRAKKSFVAFICPETYSIDKSYNDSDLNKLKLDSIKYLGYYMNREGQRLFPKQLFIVEAPGKVKALQRLLGKEFEVLATGGTIHELGLDDDSLSSKDGLIPRYRLSERGVKIIDLILKNSHYAHNIYLATDGDFVGEAIAWHLYHHLIKRKPSLETKLKRVQLRAITPDAIKIALDEVNTIDNQRAAAEISREVIDVLIARYFYQLIKKKNPLSNHNKNLINLAKTQYLIETSRQTSDTHGMGRVKAGVLNLLLKKLLAELAPESQKIKVTLSVNKKKITGYLVGHSTQLEDKLKKVSYYTGNPTHWSLLAISDERREIEPPGTSTSEVLQYAWKHTKMKPEETMNALQYLYEGNYSDN